MSRLWDRLILLVLCAVGYFSAHHGVYDVVPFLVAIATAALCSYWDLDAAITVVFAAYCLAAAFWPPLAYFLPLLCYDILDRRWPWAALAALVPAMMGLSALGVRDGVFLALFAALSVALALRTAHAERIQREALALRDSTQELALQLERKNRELLDKQDYELNLAVLGERNRIARDIHDSVGHTLSNAILQTGALMALDREGILRTHLETLRDTLKGGMDSIRMSLHDLHDEAIDLQTETRSLVDGFTFCPIALDYGIDGNPERNVKYALIAILKEALSNVIRHSNATRVRVALREHPALYQLIVNDNGTQQGPEGQGMGLKNIAQRVEALGGILSINREEGFTVFVSLPKERRRSA